MGCLLVDHGLTHWVRGQKAKETKLLPGIEPGD